MSERQLKRHPTSPFEKTENGKVDDVSPSSWLTGQRIASSRSNEIEPRRNDHLEQSSDHPIECVWSGKTLLTGNVITLLSTKM